MIYPYVKNLQIFHCPTGTHAYCDYNANNQALVGSHTSQGRKEALFVRPATTIMLYDSYGIRACGRPHGYLLDSNGSLPWCYGYPSCNELAFVPGNTYAADRSRHNDGCNYSFMDGHAKWLSNGTTYCPSAASSPAWAQYWDYD